MSDLPPAAFPATTRRMLESAGYECTRWAAAYRTLHARHAKGRLPAWFDPWITHAPQMHEEAITTLQFDADSAGRWWLRSGPAASTHARAMLHLPILRPFWQQELRQAHFDSLRGLVAPAWLLDDTPLPHGSIIAGLGITSWADFRLKHHPQHFALVDEKNVPRACEAEKLPALATEKKWLLTAHPQAQNSLIARYQTDASGRITLTDYQAMP